ncbi:IS110 family transposase [Streptomyces sp. NPDC056244]|uniref:IS110 family transposase n=1 Tax=Streptomyces sp. NPDC056244 TaxID=3345762 RepID=UPI0035DC3B10
MTTMYAGADWADGWVDCAVVRRDGTPLGHQRIVYADSTDPVEEYLDFLRGLNRTRWRTIPTAIEDPHILFGQALMDRGMSVIHVAATLAARARKAATVGGATKSDRADAYLLADMIRTGSFAPIVLSSPAARAIRILAQAQRAATHDRVRALHRLRALLVSYYPAAVTAWPRMGLRHPQARAVLAVAPSPRIAAQLTRGQIAQALRAGGRWRTVDEEAHRLRLHFRRPALSTHQDVEAAHAVEMLRQLSALDHICWQAEDLARQAAEAFARHPHYKIITSFPGVGDLLGSQILGEIGDAPGRFKDAKALSAYAGVSPVTWASGTTARVSIRRAANHALRAALYQAAFCALTRSPGAAHYYRQRRDRGATHHTTLRNLGARLARSLHHCLRHELLWDEQTAFPAGVPPANNR